MTTGAQETKRSFYRELLALAPSSAKAFVLRKQEEGLPLSTAENWRSHSLRGLHELSLYLPGKPAKIEKNLREKLAALKSPSGQWVRIVIVNGRFEPAFSDSVDPTRIEVQTIEQKESPLWSSKQSQGQLFYSEIIDHFGAESLAIKINAGVRLGLHLIHCFSSSDPEKNNLFLTRQALSLSKDVQLDLFESRVFVEELAPALHFQSREFELGEGSRLSLGSFGEKVSLKEFSNTRFICPEPNTELNIFRDGGQCDLSRIDEYFHLSGEGSRARLHTSASLTDEDVLDLRSHIDIKASKIDVAQNHRILLDGQSQSIFSGRIHIHENIRGVAAQQSSKALFLSEKAQSHSLPSLLIDSEDVKCAHGATMGQLSQDEIFYLQSRGISALDARSLLCRGFLLDGLSASTDLALWKERWSQAQG